jgi:hypothetical protein
MKKNKSSSYLSFFKTTLFVLMASSFSICYGGFEGSGFGSGGTVEGSNTIGLKWHDKVDSNFTYTIPIVSWSKDIENVVVDYTMFVKPEDKDKNKYPFLFASYCSKPSEFWLYGDSLLDLRSKHWEREQADKTPRPFSIQPPNNKLAFYYMTTGAPVDLSSIVKEGGLKECVILHAGYGLGITPREAYDEMVKQKRYDVIFDTVLGTVPREGGYKFKVEMIEMTPSSKVIILGICALKIFKGC